MNHYAPTSLTYPVNWAIRRDPVYRLLDNCNWMDNFFETGEIMLSCFKKFKLNPDEMQGDIEEGNAMIGGKDSVGNHHLLMYESGFNSYIMSTTTKITSSVIKDFNAKCAIKINNPTFFGLEIAKKLPFVSSGLEGNCIYETSRIHYFEKAIEEYKLFKNQKFINNSRSVQILKEETSGYELFLKLDKYRHQNEYRLIWFTEQHVEDSIIIKCPEAIEYCEKIRI